MIPLNQGQQDAISSVIQFITSASEREMIIKGKPGTGKSTLVEHMLPAIRKCSKVIAMLLQQDNELPLYLCSTTNKATQVLADLTGEEATTIHSLLGLTIKNDTYNGGSKLIRSGNSKVIENSLIIIDEAFSIDKVLDDYIERGTKNCKIIYIGDPKQTAPVMSIKSPIDDRVCRTVELTKVERNKGAITLLSDHWREVVDTGVFTSFTVNDPNVLYTVGADFQAEIDKAYSPYDIGQNENKIVCWTNGQSISYSDYVRKLRNMPAEFSEGEYLQINNSLPKLGFSTDTIIQIKALYAKDKFCGIEGRMADLVCGKNLFIPTSTTQFQARLKELAAKKEWGPFYEIKDRIPDLRSIHSCTVHKSQGSTYENVFIDLNDIGKCNIPSDVARMMVVATSRPTTKIVFRGSLPAKYGG